MQDTGDEMNDGYMSYLLLLTTVVLLASGWKTTLVGSISRRKILLFLMTWITGLFYVIPFGTDIQVQGLYLSVLLLLLHSMGRVTFTQGTFMITAGILTGLISYCLHTLYRIDPVLIVYDPTLDISVAVGLIAWLVSRSVWQQAVVWTLACVISEVASLIAGDITYLGSPAFQDSWWIAFGVARVLSIIRDVFVRLFLLAGKRVSLWTRALRK